MVGAWAGGSPWAWSGGRRVAHIARRGITILAALAVAAVGFVAGSVPGGRHDRSCGLPGRVRGIRRGQCTCRRLSQVPGWSDGGGWWRIPAIVRGRSDSACADHRWQRLAGDRRRSRRWQPHCHGALRGQASSLLLGNSVLRPHGMYESKKSEACVRGPRAQDVRDSRLTRDHLWLRGARCTASRGSSCDEREQESGRRPHGLPFVAMTSS